MAIEMGLEGGPQREIQFGSLALKPHEATIQEAMCGNCGQAPVAYEGQWCLACQNNETSLLFP